MGILCSCPPAWIHLDSAFTAGPAYVGNDSSNFYALQQTQVTWRSTGYWDELDNYTGVCSSPAITYSAGDGARWVFVVSRGDNGREDGYGTLYAFRTE